jgi:hypothetical protein
MPIYGGNEPIYVCRGCGVAERCASKPHEVHQH